MRNTQERACIVYKLNHVIVSKEFQALNALQSFFTLQSLNNSLFFQTLSILSPSLN